jgi:hypothetical protein
LSKKLPRLRPAILAKKGIPQLALKPRSLHMTEGGQGEAPMVLSRISPAALSEIQIASLSIGRLFKRAS